MKRAMKVLGYAAGTILVLLFVAYLLFNEKKPLLQPSTEADQLARVMLSAVNADQWEQTSWLRWSFLGRNHYVWNKANNLVKVSWQDKAVLLDTKSQQGKAFSAGVEETGRAAEKLISQGWTSFCNDSYWLNPLVKAFDPGTSRSLVTLEDGREGLMVTHESGGTTPGDSYLYLLDGDGRPAAWKMWVNIIPIGGVETSWEGWTELKGGAIVSTTHEFFGKKVEMIQNVEGGTTYSSIGLDDDPFASL